MTQVLERGNIYFIYRPRVERTSASGVEDIQRLFNILSPHGKDRHRLFVVGRKKLPEIEDHHERNWAFVQKVGRDAHEIEDELIGADEDVFDKLGIRLNPARETIETAEIFNDLRMERSEHPLG